MDCPVAGLDQYGAQRPGFEFGEQFVDAQAEHKRCWLGIARRWRYLVIDQHAKARTGSKDLVDSRCWTSRSAWPDSFPPLT